MWNKISIDKDRPKDSVVAEIESVLQDSGYHTVEVNTKKPWGGYYKIERDETERFLEEFFKNVNLPDWAQGLPLDPKILFVAPGKRLSWQYHDRRGEVWTVVRGPVGALVSDTDTMPESPKRLETGNTFQIHPKGRHRLVGLDSWGIVAEIWVHTDRDKPSDEEDIYRLQDDFGRVS